MVNLFYHGRNREQCWSEPNCLFCYIKMIAIIIRMRISIE